MSAGRALLMEIHLPGNAEPLCLMSGQGFEVLRTDTTGREIYGLAHSGREYLFFPLSFRPVDAGVLSMHMPAEYRESCPEHLTDGARIVFKATHGTPCFADMPEEYRSSSGVLRAEPSGALRVLLDKLEPGSAAEHCDCGHAHQHEAHAHSPDCGCGDAAGHDAALARDVREQALALNKVLRRAAAAGLLLELDIAREAEEACPEIRVVKIARPL